MKKTYKLISCLLLGAFVASPLSIHGHSSISETQGRVQTGFRTSSESTNLSDGTTNSSSDVDSFIIEMIDGQSVCRKARTDEVRMTLPRPGDLGVPVKNLLGPNRTVSPGDDSLTELTIDFVALPQLQSDPNMAVVITAFQRAAAVWTNRIKSPVTISIKIDYGINSPSQMPFGNNTLGSTSSRTALIDYAGARNNLILSASSAFEHSIYSLLPTSFIPTDTGNGAVISANRSTALALGIPITNPADTNVATMGFNKNFPFDFNPDDGITPGTTDFVAVATHEIGHALGFVSNVGIGNTSPISLWDIFRFRPGMTVGTFSTATRVQSVGGEQVYFTGETFLVNGSPVPELRLSTGGPDGSGGDLRQSSHWKDDGSISTNYIGIMDPTIPSGRLEVATENDFMTLERIGWNLLINTPPPPPPPAPPPPANDNFVNAQVIGGCSGTTAGLNVGATREVGEPNHSPDNGGGRRSVWYQWQAQTPGTVTFTTAGSAFDTVLGIWIGSSLTTLIEVGRSDDISGSDKTSSVTFTATAGTIYRIAVDGYDNNNSGGDFGTLQLNWTATTCGSLIQFSQASYPVGEAGTKVDVTVTRSGDTSGTSTVDYTTTDTDNFTIGCSQASGGNAFGRCDFATSVDTLTFAPGETSKTFAIPIINDSIAEGSETFGVTLSNVTGATLGSPATATVTITDNDAVTGPNPIFTTPFFVRQHYLDFLSREPEVGEPWSAILNGCSDVNNNPACDRLTVSGSFFGSPEFQLKGLFVYRFYKLAFNRLPLYSEIVVDMRAVTGATAAETFQKKATFTNNFVARTEFINLYNAQTNTQYVNTLMGRYSLGSIMTPDPANPDGATKVTLTTADLINRLNGVGGTLTRAQVLRAIADSDQVLAAETNQSFVAMQYYGYLRRTPDPAGFNAWLNHLTANPTDFRTMVNGFMNSAEYRLRFGPPN